MPEAKSENAGLGGKPGCPVSAFLGFGQFLNRHSRKNKKNQKQQTEIPPFPRRRESGAVGTETYREKKFL